MMRITNLFISFLLILRPIISHGETTSSYSIKNSRFASPSRASKAIEYFRNDLKRIDDLPISKLTTPCWLVSRDSTFTKSWDFDDWERHQKMSAIRYSRHLLSWFRSPTAANILPTIVIVACWTVLLFRVVNRKAINMSSTKFAMTLGFIQAPILLMLTLKTNRALDRMLETRKAWGVLSKATRTFTNLNMVYLFKFEPEITLLIVRYLAFFGWSLKATYRKDEDDTEMIQTLFEHYPDEKEYLLSSPTKRPVAIVTRIRYLLSLLSGSSTPPTILLRMEELIYDIETTIGICARVFVSPVPPTYTRHTSRVLLLYMFLMPAALIGTGVALVPAVLTACFASYVLVGIDEIGNEIEYPFNLLPMFSMSKGIQTEVSKQVDMNYNMAKMRLP